MKAIKYKFRHGSRLPAKQSAAAGKHLAALHNEHGSLTPEVVLDDAKRKSSPLHGLFQWDNSRAAHEYRLWQARHLIRSVVVVYETKEGPRDMHAYVQLRKTEEAPRTPYMATPSVLSDSDLRERLLQQALDDIADWETRYRDLKELADVFAALKKLRAKAARKPLKKRRTA